MASTFFGLGIATSGMQAYQASLNTTSHNLSNMGAKGYTKQSVNLGANPAISIIGSYGMIGSGVAIQSITQERNQYYDDKYRYNNAIYGNYSTKEYYLACIEGYIYSEDNTVGGITTSFDDFFNSLTTLTSEASDMTKRTDAVILSESFSQYVVDFADSLQTLQDEANTQIETVIAQINGLGSEIASLTQRINTYEISGENANDLRDQRNVLVDELSQYVNIEVQETAAQEGVGNNQFMVYIDGSVLVDSTVSNSIQCVASKSYVNQNDILGLYNLEWSNGQDLNMRSTTLGGVLQSLIEVRDGNNLSNFEGSAASLNTEGEITKITVTDVNCNDLYTLNIPESQGRITIGNIDYEYDSFEVTINDDGTYTYEFALRGTFNESQIESLTFACDNAKSVKVGEKVDYKGIPYYMAQLNEFVRTFSSRFNEIHNEGYDLDNNAGIDWFNMKDKITEENYVFDENVGVNGTRKFASVISKDANGIYNSSYYNMTAVNFAINREILDNPRKVACQEAYNIGIENNVNLARLIALKSDNSMFKQGTPDAYIQTLIATTGIDGKQAKMLTKSQGNVIIAIDTRRQSVSGVDQDEESADLVKFQNLLFTQYKVLSVMDEVLDKLINGTAV